MGLLDRGVGQGDHIAIIGSNRPELYWSMVAAQTIGAIPVPVYQDAVPDEMIYILEHCNVKFVIAEETFFKQITHPLRASSQTT